VNAQDINLGVLTDPAQLLVEAAQPASVDTVVMDGRILKRRGKLTALDAWGIVRDASFALARVRRRGDRW